MPNVILTVDDSPTDTMIYNRFLSKSLFDHDDMQFKVISLNDMSQLEHFFKSVEVDCVILDYKLEGGVDGLDVIKQIRSQSHKIGILFLTGYGDENVVSSAFKYGADDYLSKQDLTRPRLQITVKNILDKKRRESAEAKNTAELNLLREAIENSHSLMLMCEPEMGMFVTFNKQLSHFLDKSPEQIKSSNFPAITPYFDNIKAWQKFSAELKLNSVNNFEMLLTDSSGQNVPFEMDCCYCEIDNKEYVLLSGTDISKLKQTQHQLEELTITDPLTGIYNRRGLDHYFRQSLKSAARENYCIGVGVFDIDNFKKINDQYGHKFGDKILVSFSQLLKDKIRRPMDIVARIGGEEFLVVLANSTHEEMVSLINKIIKELPKITETHSTVSCGLVFVNNTSLQGYARTDNQDYLESLFSQADKFMYQAKQAGKNCLVTNS